jgi:glycyl-tRNA synthetase beta chain
LNEPLLVELLTEELPPKALRALGDAFARRLFESLAKQGLVAPGTAAQSFATPRRLAVLIPGVLARAEDRAETRKLMPAKVAFDEKGARSAALRKRLEKEGADPENAPLERRLEAGVESVFLARTVEGVTLAGGLQSALDEAIGGLPIPKTMSYQLADGETTVNFVRPVHGLVALHGTSVVDVGVLGLKAGQITRGHRFQGAREIPLARAETYEEALRAHGKVIASFEGRRAEIERQLRAKAGNSSLGPEEDLTPLLDEVTALVEWPSVYEADFEQEFLAVPQECLILTMRQNQKYFPLFDAAGRLTNRFLLVSNMDLVDPSNVVEGNRRVVRPRLADARFFFETDKKTRLDSRVQQLSTIVYHNKLGKQLDRVGRVKALAALVAKLLGQDEEHSQRAAELAKADLVSLMVGEFPELQGIMGRYYALFDGEPAEVAAAIEEHYRPRFAGDRLPSTGISTVLALADKLETLAGMFGIGQQPTGDRDPFALRRHALGIIRILVEHEIPVSLLDLVNAAFSVFPKGMIRDTGTDLQTFVFDRLKGYLRDAGYTANEIESVLCLNPLRLDQIPRQLAAVRAFAGLPEAESLSAANKRVANILRQAETKGEKFGNVTRQELKESAEIDLFDALRTASKSATVLFSNGDYTGYLKTFAVLKSPVDAFFDKVMVMAEDPALRRSRLALLRDLRDEMNRVADISKLAA